MEKARVAERAVLSQDPLVSHLPLIIRECRDVAIFFGGDCGKNLRVGHLCYFASGRPLSALRETASKADWEDVKVERLCGFRYARLLDL